MKEIQLTQGMVSIVDDDDFEMVNAYKWHAAKSSKGSFYAQRMRLESDGKRRKTGIHNEIMSIKSTRLHVDHINGDTLDNRRANLRICTRGENLRNQQKQYNATKPASSKYKGVSFIAGKWMVQVRRGKDNFVVRCHDEVLAAKIYNVAAAHYYGEFAKLNEIPATPSHISE